MFSFASYFSVVYLVAFLPAVVIVYSLVPQRVRWVVLLCASYVFFWLISSKLIVFILLSTLSVYGTGRWLASVIAARDAEVKAAERSERKAIKARYLRKLRGIAALGIGFNFALLIALKYLVFFAEVASSLLALCGVTVSAAVPSIGVPIGISFYTMMAASYLFDIYRGTITADKHLGRVALFLAFFPDIMEGPMCRYDQIAADLYAGAPVRKDDLYAGSVRILFGVAKKMIVADRLNLFVKPVFADYSNYDGGVIALAAIFYTIQLYCDFSGAMDVVIGSAKIFGVKLPENFNHPFFSRTASEFWQRWHITLGAWLRDYVFYPVSLSAPVKSLTKAARARLGGRAGSLLVGAIPLFCVWIINGLWHGAGSQYIFFGMYYFVLILLGGFIDPLGQKIAETFGYSRTSKPYIAFQLVRTLIVIFVGELFFRAEGLDAGLAMFSQMTMDFTLDSFTNGTVLSIGMDACDYLAVAVSVVVLLVIALIEEFRGVRISEWLCSRNLALRWVALYVLIVLIVVFGSYGVGTAPLDPIYAQF